MSTRNILPVLTCLLALTAISGGNAAPSERVVGGADATVGQFPHQVSLQREDGSHTCGGSIISKTWIVTAAHCVVVGQGIEPYPARFFQVRVGSIQRTVGGELLKVKRVIVNKGYADFENDIALLELEKPLVFTKNIQPIELATEEVPAEGAAIISGWGRLSTEGPLPHRLQWNTLKILDEVECKKVYERDDSVICLAHDPDQGTCFGDSGGPATYKGKLVGVASFVSGACGTAYPDGYAKVSHLREWIRANSGV